MAFTAWGLHLLFSFTGCMSSSSGLGSSTDFFGGVWFKVSRFLCCAVQAFPTAERQHTLLG